MRKVTNHYFVSPQIESTDVKSLKDQGFESIVCNRPDGEEPNQPDFKSIEKECLKSGIKFTHYRRANSTLQFQELQILDLSDCFLVYFLCLKFLNCF